MARRVFHVEAPILRLTVSEFEAIPESPPGMLCDLPVGTRWRERCWGGVRVREMRGISQDGLILHTWRPVIRVPAVSRLVPRPEAAA